MKSELLLSCLLSLSCWLTVAAENYILCAYNKGSIEHLPEDGFESDTTEVVEQQQKRCDSNYCYTLWQEDGNNRSIILGQGCWAQSGDPNECDKSACLADKPPPPAKNNTKFCCCSQNNCNRNFTDIYVPLNSSLETTTLSPKKDHSLSLIIWTALGVVFIMFVLMVSVGAYYFWKKAPKKNDAESGHHHPLAPPPDYSLDKLKIINIIGQGKYGSVWRGVIDEEEVAVKVFPSHYRNCFFTEYEIYKAVGDHPCILKCFGGGEYSRVLGHPEYALLLNIEQQSLQEYLKNNTTDLPTLSKMSLDIARGLSHLHSDIGKPCIAHRDLNSKNILVRSDRSCCICDLGLAIIPRSAESKALSEAGTLRYMSPEVLEGAVNLRDCESALKQTDVYALGLVIWELGSRCTDMQNAEPQPYMPPFYKEIEDNPSLEQMQNLVSRQKMRPKWPISWKDTAAARLLCETAEDCWDQDAEARLTALCVVERFLDLPNMKGRVLHPMHPPASPTLINNNHLHDNPLDNSAATVETLLSPTAEDFCKNSNQLAICVLPLQPHQGRNPCLERNLLSSSSDSLLIDKSSKHCTASSETQNLLTNEFLNYQVNNRANPIPYVQNPVYGMPKQQNIAQVPVMGQNQRKKFRWSSFKKLLYSGRNSENRNAQKETQVRLKSKIVNGTGGQPGVTTALLAEPELKRPCSLGLSVAKPLEFTNNSGVTQILRRKNSLSRQRSLEQFTEVFSSITDLSRLKDPNHRVKTPGDVPPSVRKTRGRAAENSARFSLYDDRMMGKSAWGSAPDLEPQRQANPPSTDCPIISGDNSASVSSF